MNVHILISFFSAELSLALGFVVITLNRKSPVHRAFLLFSLAVTYLGFVEFGYRQAETLNTAVLWLRLNALTPLVPSILLFFSIVYSTRRTFRQSPWVAALVFVPALIWSYVDARTGILSGEPSRAAWGWRYDILQAGWRHLYTIWLSVVLTVPAVLCFTKYFRENVPRKRNQARWVAYGMLIPAVFTFCTMVVFPYAEFRLPELTTLGFAVSNMVIGYAMWRHKLFILTPATAADRIIAMMSDSLFITEPTGEIVFANEAGAALLNSSVESLVGRFAADLFQVSEPTRERLGKLLKGGAGVSDLPAIVNVTGKEEVSVSLSASVLLDKLGRSKGAILICRDITERVNVLRMLQQTRNDLEKRVELRTTELVEANARIAREKELLDVTLESIGDGVIASGTQGTIALMNRKAEQLTGWRAEEAVGRKVREVLDLRDPHSGDRTIDPAAEALRKQTTVQFENDIELISRSGDRRLVSDSAAPIQMITGECLGAVIVFRDVSEKKRLEDELFRMRKLEAVGVLAGGIAHDFNNMLAAMVSNLFLLKMGMEPGSEQSELVNTTEMAALRAQRLTKQLLTFAGGGEPIRRIASMKNLIEETIGFLLSGSVVEYALDIDDDLHPVEMDRGQIDQVLTNLVFNAEQAMPGGGMVYLEAHNEDLTDESTEVQPNDLELGNYVVVSVRDEGKGIKREVIDRIFDPFFSTKKAGRGLGLSIVYSVIKKHGGIVTVNSSEGAGATFTFYLPAADVPEFENGGGVQLEDDSANTHSGRVLLMDDDETVLHSTGAVLERMGYDIEKAQSGAEAIEIYKDTLESGSPFDVVLLDLTVPGGIGGRECFTQLQHLDPDVCAIVTSGFSFDPVMAHYSEYGFSGVLTKPYSIGDLISEIQRNIRVKTSSKQETKVVAERGTHGKASHV